MKFKKGDIVKNTVAGWTDIVMRDQQTMKVFLKERGWKRTTNLTKK